MNRDKSSDGRGFLLNLCRISSGHPRGCPIGGRIGPGVGRHEACPYVAVERLAPGLWKGSWNL